jgi:hypothetical protein
LFLRPFHSHLGGITGLLNCCFNQAQLQDNIKPSTQRWQEVARLVDSRGTVQDIEFAPSYLGLRLATISVDGVLRIYEAMDIVNLAHWTLMVIDYTNI